MRVVSLIAAFAIATAVAARVDTATVAAHQVVNTMFTLLALSLDAFAIPAQTLVAEALGAATTASPGGSGSGCWCCPWWSGMA